MMDSIRSDLSDLNLKFRVHGYYKNGPNKLRGYPFITPESAPWAQNRPRDFHPLL